MYGSIHIAAGAMALQGSMSKEIFKQYLTYIPSTIKYLSASSFLIGVIYFVWGEVDELKKSK